ncbi:DALR anticodon-binding domain-containing protein 3-like [Littorina saxatilis]|uniref:DALR anticodon-binding domain-containing protein 3-like n=1 Tax=Littorina saxatilis TaxID=31220 RepID=UPI0038B4EDD3
MASEIEDRYCQLVKNALKETCVDSANIKVCRKSKDLPQGDFVIPRGVLDIDLDSETVKAVHLEDTIVRKTASDVLPMSRLSHDKYNSVIFFIDRKKAFGNIIQQVLTAGENYGLHPVGTRERVIVNPVDLHVCSTQDQSQAPTSLIQLRAVILLKHVLQLFIFNGYDAEIAQFPATENVQDLLDAFNVKTSLSVATDLDKTCEQLLEKAQVSSWREELTSNTERNQRKAREECGDGEKEKNSVVLNLRKYLADEGLQVGKNGYDKNLNLANVKLENGTMSDVLREAAVIELIMSGPGQAGIPTNAEGSKAVCVHLVSQSLAFTQQQADLIWRVCSPSPVPHALIQRHLVFGSIGRRKSSTSVVLDAKEFYNVRHTQMTQAAMMKYGDHDQGAAWDDMIAGLTAASISFDVLSSASSSQVQLDLSQDEGEGGVDNRSGPFVLYNCARLATLLQSFEQQVEQGVYPDLPDPSEIDFGLLREEEEWTLALLYVHGFPRLVQDTLTSWQQTQGITAEVQTHKVAHFLLNFAKILSSYYSRYHVLGGREAHLLPLMYARLSLVKAAHRVLCNGLRLLGLQPFAQL